MLNYEELSERFVRLLRAVPPDQEKVSALLNEWCAEWEKSGPQCLLEKANAARYYCGLLHVLQATHQEGNIQTLLQLILDTAIDLTCAERGFLLLQDLEVARHFDGTDIVGDYKISRNLAEMVQRTGQTIVTGNAQSDERLSTFDSIRSCRTMSILCIPILAQDQTIGVLYLDNRLVSGNFQEAQTQLLKAFAQETATALQKARLYQELLDRSQKIHVLNVELQRKMQKQTRELELVRKKLKTMDSPCQYENIYAKSPKMREVFRILEKIKDHEIPVLILGESGTGKELVARAIHFASHRRDCPFISENCAAIPDTLLESELFGYEKGAFSGAAQMKKGLFEQAQQGTLFLDEVAELPIDSQKKLLRVLAEKQIRRVGGHQALPVDVRIITATNRDLKEMMEEGDFREDLFYRLNGITITLPPLRERREDIPLLVEHFLEEAAQPPEEPKQIDRNLVSLFIGYDWPGNIRQLRNEILRLAALSGPVLEAKYLSPELLPSAAKSEDKIQNLAALLREVERKEILKALHIARQNKSHAAQLLGISRFTLLRKMEKYGML
jgi:transcriptional regulator with GAF, ATPase, and Fis domain